MKFSDLQKISKADQQRRNLVRKGLEQYDLRSYLRYLRYRIKWPILFKLLSRLIVIVEVILIQQLFTYNIFADLTLYIFIIFISRSALKGITQYYRVQLMPLATAKNISGLNIALSKALIINIFSAFLLALVISILCLLLDLSDQLNTYFIISWCLLIPLEQITTQLWNTVYLNTRLRRSALITFICRMLPIISLLAFSSLIGPLSYILGTFMARLLESFYLSRVAILALKFKFTLKKKSSSLLQVIGQYFKNQKARQYLYFNAILPCYFLGLGLIIFERGVGTWITNIIYFFILNFAVFFTTQISRSIQFDIYSCFKKGQVKKATFLGKRIVKYTLNFAVILAASFIYLLLNSKRFYLFIPISLEYFLLILPLAVIAQTFFFSIYAQIQSLAIDRYFTKLIFISFLLIGLPIQFLLFHYYLANLQAIYWTEILLFVFVGTLLYLNLNFNLSPFLIKYIKRERKALPLCQPTALQLELRTKYIKTGSAYLYILSYYERDAFWERIKYSLPQTKDFLITRYSAGLFLLSSHQPLTDLDFRNLSFVAKKQIDLSQELLQTLLDIYTFYYSLEFRNSSFQKIRNKFYLNRSIKEELYQLAELKRPVDQIISELLGAPRIVFKNGKISCLGKVSNKLYNFALNQYFYPDNNLAPAIQGSQLTIRINNTETISFDLRHLNSYLIGQVNKKIFFLNQYYYFKNIIDPHLPYAASIQDYLIARRLIHKHTRRCKTRKADHLADLNFYNHKLV